MKTKQDEAIVSVLEKPSELAFSTGFVPREGSSLDYQIERELRRLKVHAKIRAIDANLYEVD